MSPLLHLSLLIFLQAVHISAPIFLLLLPPAQLNSSVMFSFNLQLYLRGEMLVTRAISRSRRFYYSFINRLALYRKTRWTATLVLVFSYFQTVKAASYDIATYLIGFYLLQLLIGYFTPRGVAEHQDEGEEQHEPIFSFTEEITTNAACNQRVGFNLEHSEDKPLARSLSQIEIWQRATFAFIMGTACTYFKMIEIDVFWPLLLVYFIVLACYTIQKILRTMQTYKYGLADFQKQPI